MKEFSSLRNTNRAGPPGGKWAWLVLAASCCLAASPLARADSGWLWLDGSGHKVYSDMPPPPSVRSRNILRRPNADMTTPLPLSAAEPANAAARAQAPAGQNGTASSLDRPATPSAALSDAELRTAVDKRNAEIRLQNCRQAREALTTLSSELPLITTDAQGEPVALSDEARATEIRRLRQAEQDNCRPKAAAQ